MIRWLALLACFGLAHSLRVGVGIADVTGPCAEIIFMGYANSAQAGHGIHLRQFSRAFIFEEDGQRLVYVSVDAAMMGHGVRREVVKRLVKYYGDIYSEDNVIISGTHTHSTPGGFLLDFLFDFSTFGFVKETFVSYISGIFKSIVYAHKNLKEAKIEYAEGELLEANINRSPTAYLKNPEEERAKYKYNVDKNLAQVRIKSTKDNTLMGVINWFAVHPTSMNNTNLLISSDNVGYASILMEKALNSPGTLPGKGSIVCAFASTNLGDVSPNIRGPKCEFSGSVCDAETMLCEKGERCIASGPGENMFESTRIIATRLFNRAMELLVQNGEDLTGPVSYVHQFVEMPNEVAPSYDPVSETFNTSNQVKGCVSAMGYSFAAGTTDGPGLMNFTQGTTSTNPMWVAVRDFIAPPTHEDVVCQSPKPILLATGRIKFPYQWQPQVVSVSIGRVGGLFLTSVPGELTTMAGRRLRDVVKRASKALAKRVVLCGLSNIYSDYITTFEEYQLQRYEAASTIYGPHTLEIYLNKYTQLADALIKGERMNSSVEPLDLTNALITLVPPVLWDSAPWKQEFGDCVQQPFSEYGHGDTVVAKFISGHPRNNLLHGKSFLAIERLIDEENEDWQVIAIDANWETKFIWRRESKVLGTSIAEIQWDIPWDTPIGIYRIHHYGNYKYILGGIYPYHGFSNSFKVK